LRRSLPELPQDLRGSYEWIRARLIRGLELAGLAAERSRAQAGADRLELCFAGATGYEVELDGEKLIGSAQRRGAARSSSTARSGWPTTASCTGRSPASRRGRRRPRPRPRGAAGAWRRASPRRSASARVGGVVPT
jgi:hypothetical protein